MKRGAPTVVAQSEEIVSRNKTIELTWQEAHFIHELIDAAAYGGPPAELVQEVYRNSGIEADMGKGRLDELLESIFEKTK